MTTFVDRGQNSGALITSVADTSTIDLTVTDGQLTADLIGGGSFLEAANNLSDLANVATARTNLGLVSGGAGDIWVEKAGDTMTGQLISTLAIGTSPFAVTSTTVNTNLNADLLDGLHSSSFIQSVTDTSTVNLTLTGTELSADVIAGGVDHGGLGGLTDDDHSQYALLIGRSGGQILIGGTGTTDDLTFQTTSGVGTTGADMHFLVGSNGGTEAMTILNSGYIGAGVTPTAKLHLKPNYSSAGTRGAEMFTTTADRTFASDSGHWTKGANWTISGGRLNHSAGANNASLDNTYLSAAPVAGLIYQITFTLRTTVLGVITCSFGGTNCTALGGTTNTMTAISFVITATNTNLLTFTPDGTWVGDVDNVSVFQLTASTPDQIWESSDGSTYANELRTISDGSSSLFIGKGGGKYTLSSTYDNLGIGYFSALSNVSGNGNFALGAASLQNAVNAGAIVSIGEFTLFNLRSGTSNTAVGNAALFTLLYGNNNSVSGANAAYYLKYGNNNTIYGSGAGGGSGLTNASGLALFGYQAGANETGSNKLYIANSNTATPLIYGEFDGATGVGVKIHSPLATAVALIVKGITSQSANLQDWQNNSGTSLSGVDERGVIFSNAGTDVTNTFIGEDAGNKNTTADDCVALGGYALQAITSGSDNLGIGTRALNQVTTGSSNVAIGINAGRNNTSTFTTSIGSNSQLGVAGSSTGSGNTSVGNNALRGIAGGGSNTAIGPSAGFTLTTGDTNIFIGSSAGYRQTTNSNLLIIDSKLRADTATELTNAILYGATDTNVTNQDLRINADVLIGSVNATALTIGVGATGTDYQIKIDGETNDLTLTYMEDEDRLDISSDINVAGDIAGSNLTLSTSLKILEGGATPSKYTIFQGGDQSVDITYTLPTTIGAAGTYLKDVAGNGVLSWATVAGGGDVTKVGTPVDNQVGVWTGDGTLEGTSGLTYDGSNLLLTGDIGATGTRITKIWATDLTVTNAIAGSVTGNAATVTDAINGDFRYARRGLTGSIGTIVGMSDDDVAAVERWIHLSENSGAWTVAQDTDAPSGSLHAAKISKFGAGDYQSGMVYIMEKRDAIKYIGNAMSVSLQVKTTGTEIGNLMMAVLSWTGTADAVTSDVIGTWASGGSEPTWAANWTREGITAQFALTASYQKISLENVSIDTASTNNIAIVIWADDATYTAGDDWWMGQFQMNTGATVATFKANSPTLDEVLCNRYIHCTTGETTQSQHCNGHCSSTVNHLGTIIFPEFKFSAPVMPAYVAAADFAIADGVTGIDITAMAVSNQSKHGFRLDSTIAGATQWRPYFVRNDGNASRSFYFDCEM